MPRTLHAGDRGPDVLALQQALHKALGKKALNNKLGVYGSLTVRDVALFKRGWTSQFDGHIAGALVWTHIAQYLGHAQRRLLAKAHSLELAEQTQTREQAVRRAIVAEAYWGLANNGLFTYRQYRPMVVNLHDESAFERTDCSAFVTGCYHGGGAPDPNGRGFDGQGYTGTLWSRGTAIASPGPSDLAFYGNMGASFGFVPSHVALVWKSSRVISFGHTPISEYPLRYRTDYRGARHYAVA